MSSSPAPRKEPAAQGRMQDCTLKGEINGTKVMGRPGLVREKMQTEETKPKIRILKNTCANEDEEE
jgi:hypothetical protein